MTFDPLSAFPFTRTYFLDPPSFRAKNKDRKAFWKYLMQDTLGLETLGHNVTVPVHITIRHYFWERKFDDVDNKSKPILDNLTDYVYEDDHLVDFLKYHRIPIESSKARDDLFFLDEEERSTVAGKFPHSERRDVAIITLELAPSYTKENWLKI
jgi:Holliday junction resolvase RusA-like endonuclease